jgi:hypothetical protein
MKRAILACLLIVAAFLILGAFAQRQVSSGQINQVSGDGNVMVTTKGAQTAGKCVTIDAQGNHVPSASSCGGDSGGGVTTFPTSIFSISGSTATFATGQTPSKVFGTDSSGNVGLQTPASGGVTSFPSSLFTVSGSTASFANGQIGNRVFGTNGFGDVGLFDPPKTVLFQTNGSANGEQNYLNLQDGAGIHLTQVSGIVTISNALPVAVGSLPTCNGAAEGAYRAATDLTTPTHFGIAVGGGAVHGPVYCDGTNWITP